MKNIYFVVFIFISTTVFCQTNTELEQGIIQRHNYHRNIQNAPDIKWSDELAQDAQQWADILADEDEMMHSQNQWGENIYMSSEQVTPEYVVDFWAKEQQYYNGEAISKSNIHLFGHYTQLIWAETEYVGCAYAVSNSGVYYWVCEYSPPGNFLDKKPVENYKKQKK